MCIRDREYPCCPVSISQQYVDYVVQVDSIGDPVKAYPREPQDVYKRQLLSIHNQDCLSCPRSGDCELQKLCREYGVDNHMAFEGEKNHYEIDTLSLIHI